MQSKADRARTKNDAARIRADYFRWHQGEMRQKLTEVAEREGLKMVVIDAAWTSRTCHVCETVWEEDSGTYGRVTRDRFCCSCGYEGHADHNAAINIARRGIEHHHDPTKFVLDKNGKSPLLGKKARENRKIGVQPSAAK